MALLTWNGLTPSWKGLSKKNSQSTEPTPDPAAPSQSQSSPPAFDRQDTAPPAPLSPWVRNARQLGLFFAGAGFMAASIAVARRSVLRRQLAALPRFYVSNRAIPTMDPSDRSMMAVHALGLATLNVMSFGIMLTGGVSWAFDLCSVSELRDKSRAVLHRDMGDVDPESEHEMEQMMDSLLAKLGMEKPEEESEAGDQTQEQVPKKED